MFLEAWLLESGARLLGWGTRHPRHIAAILTAIAIPVITSALLEDSGVSGGFGTVAMLSGVVLGIGIGAHSENLGHGSRKWRDWSAVSVGAILGLTAVLGFVVFMALFGTLIGLYAAAAAFGMWLALRLAVALVGMVTARRS